MNILEMTGLTKEKLAEMVTDKIAATILTDHEDFYDDETGESGKQPIPTAFARGVRKAVVARIDGEVDRIADEYIAPRVAEMVNGLVFPQTNSYGEKKGEPLTLREHLMRRAENWVTEQVNHEGKSQTENGGYSWSGKQTRLAHMVNKHLQYEINAAVTNALKDINGKLANGIAETVKLQLGEVLAKLKIGVTT